MKYDLIDRKFLATWDVYKLRHFYMGRFVIVNSQQGFRFHLGREVGGGDIPTPTPPLKFSDNTPGV